MCSLRVVRWIAPLAGFLVSVIPTQADLEVSASVQIHATADFESHLAAHGSWVEVRGHGRCWRPAGVAVGWRPYGVGEWVWTDCGWYWASSEPWGWACYHYGWWVHEPGFGWVWVPHVEWAPAWVSWRVGGGHIGWAPCGPPGHGYARRPKAEWFVFVGEPKFGGPVKSSMLIVNSSAVFKSTTEIGGVKRESRTVGGSARTLLVNHGPSVESVQKASGKRLSPRPIGEVAGRNPGPPKPTAARTGSKSSPEKSGGDSSAAHAQRDRTRGEK